MVWSFKNTRIPIWKAIAISSSIAFFEYYLVVPAKRYGLAAGINGFQLKITQEVITHIVFAVFAVVCLKESFHWKYIVSSLLILAAVYFAFMKGCSLVYLVHKVKRE